MKRTVTKVKVGDMIKMRGIHYRVNRVFPFFVMAQGINTLGRIESVCFNLGDLVVAGYEPRYPVY